MGGEDREPSGTLRIAGIERVSADGRDRVVCALEKTRQGRDGAVTDAVDLYFEVPGEYGDFLVWERCDAFVVLLLHTALSEGYDIVSDVPMSSDLYFNITEYLLPPLMKNGPRDIRILADVAPPLECGDGVGTGLSCGVDSLHSVYKYADYPIEEFRLTHLCINDVGAFGDYLYWKVGGTNVRDSSYGRARAAAADIGLPLIETSSNVARTLRLNHLLTHTFSSAFAVLCMKKLWRCYYYASAGLDHVSRFSLEGWWTKKPATYEPLLLRVLSTPSLRFYSVGEIESKLDKISDISGYEIARKHLYSCTWDVVNCGVCRKCIRNLASLDALGKLDGFSGVYDLGHYREHKAYHMWKVYDNKGEWSFAPVYRMLVERGDPVMKEVVEIAGAVERFDELWKDGTAESDKKAVLAIRPYVNRAKKANFRMARAYETGRGVKKSREKAEGCLEYCLEELRDEVGAGF